jgi:hypothetical protein
VSRGTPNACGNARMFTDEIKDLLSYNAGMNGSPLTS